MSDLVGLGGLAPAIHARPRLTSKDVWRSILALLHAGTPPAKSPGGEDIGEEDGKRMTEREHKRKEEGRRKTKRLSPQTTRGLCVDWGSLSTRTPLRHWSQRPGSCSPNWAPNVGFGWFRKPPNPGQWSCTDFGVYFCSWCLKPVCAISVIHGHISGCMWMTNYGQVSSFVAVFIQKSKIPQSRNFGKWILPCFAIEFGELYPCSLAIFRCQRPWSAPGVFPTLGEGTPHGLASADAATRPRSAWDGGECLG